jgi:TIR domain
MAKDNLLLGLFEIDFAATANANIELELTIDINATGGVIDVELKNRSTGERRVHRIEAADPFAREFKDRIDEKSRFTEEHLAALRVQANELLNIVDAALNAHGKHIRADVLRRVAETREGLQRAMQSRDAAELAGALAAFSKASNMKPPVREAVPIPAPVEVKAVAPHRSVFVSYARADRIWLDRLRIYLAPLERSGKLEIWHDAKIKAGVPWEIEIERALANAAAAILLVTANFMASTFIYENELPRILERNRSLNLAVFPIFIGHCLYQSDPALSRLNAFNEPKRPLSAMSKTEAEAEFVRLARELWQNLES